MDSKLVKDSKLADLILSTEMVVAAVKDIPGASIDSGNVVLDLTKFGTDAVVVLAEAAGEIATISVSGTDATLDFTSAATTATIVKLFVKLPL